MLSADRYAPASCTGSPWSPPRQTGPTAWITQRAGRAPAPVATAVPAGVPYACRARSSAMISGPPARWIAPSTPPPPASAAFAALPIASAAIAVLSPSTRTSSPAPNWCSISPPRGRLPYVAGPGHSAPARGPRTARNDQIDEPAPAPRRPGARPSGLISPFRRDPAYPAALRRWSGSGATDSAADGAAALGAAVAEPPQAATKTAPAYPVDSEPIWPWCVILPTVGRPG